MIEFPESAAFGKKIALVQLKKKGLKARLLEMVKSLTWAYKLAPSTINLAATESVKEVEVLDLTLRGEGDKTRNFALIIEQLAKMIPNPCICRLFSEEGGELGVAVCPKASGGALYGDSPAFRLCVGRDAVPSTSSAGGGTPALPIGVTTLESYLIHFAANLSGIEIAAEELLRDFIARHYKLESLKSDLADLEKKIAKEIHFDKKYELTKQRQRLQKEIQLTAGG